MSEVTLDLVHSAIENSQTDYIYTFTKRDTALYALGVGAPSDWLDQDELKFVYERHSDFCALPTMPVVYSSEMIYDIIKGDIHGIRFNPMMLVHGEQTLSLEKQLPVEGTITCHMKIRDIFDKGSGMALVMEATCTDEVGETLAILTSNYFIRGLGGFGGERGSSDKIVMPEREPDAIYEEKTLETQALLYRLSGDINPLHADPEMAQQGNFETPILHGLATYGFAGRAIIKHFADNDPSKFKSMQGRFSREVYPGDTLVTEMWESDEGILFQMKARDRDVVVLSGGKAILIR